MIAFHNITLEEYAVLNLEDYSVLYLDSLDPAEIYFDEISSAEEFYPITIYHRYKICKKLIGGAYLPAITIVDQSMRQYYVNSKCRVGLTIQRTN